jgi:Flp pilus assembly protein TadG
MIKATSAASWKRLARRLLGDVGGAMAVEFAILAPTLIVITAAAFEFLWLMYDYQSATDATREGVRTALISDTLADLANLETTDIVCTFSGGSTSCAGGTVESGADTAFAAIVAAMQQPKADVANGNVQVTYSWSQVDGAGSPLKTPLVTVALINMNHELFLLPQWIGGSSSFTMPAFSASRLAHSQPY